MTTIKNMLPSYGHGNHAGGATYHARPLVQSIVQQLDHVIVCLELGQPEGNCGQQTVPTGNTKPCNLQQQATGNRQH
jgi:hypothetical protein